uniref:UBC core domain-containing protein n=1 Tax=Terrapene triunguis TaxID=2587831 RepID=A0A674JL14_9SAUR
MKELRDIYRSQSYKTRIYSVELVNDSLYEWHIKFLKVDPDSLLHKNTFCGGALCMELPTKWGWSNAYSICNSSAHQSWQQQGPGSVSRGSQSYKYLVQIHEKNGWCTPPKEDG